MYVYILHALYVQVAGFLTVNRNYILFVVLWCVTYLHVNMKKKIIVDVIMYAASTKYVLTVYQDYFNFQVPTPNILNILVMGVAVASVKA